MIHGPRSRKHRRKSHQVSKRRGEGLNWVAEVRILLLQSKLSELEKEVKGMTIEKGISYLNNQEKKVIESFVKELRKRLGNNIISIRLFGSKVKGDFKEDSDIDIFILVKEKREAKIPSGAIV